MPLFTDQDRIVVRPGESIAATIYAENDSDRGGMFTLTLEPTDPNLRGDWYTATIEPRALAIAAGATEKFEVRITAKRSPHGSTRIIEFNLRAAQGGVGAGAPAPGVPQAPGPAQPTPGGLADIFRQAFQGGGSGTANEGGVNLDDVALGGSGSVSEPLFAAPAPPPDVNLFQPAAPAAASTSRLISLGNRDDAYVTIDEIPSGKSAAPPPAADPNDPAASGSVRGVMIGSLYLYVPPIPQFHVEIFPYVPDDKKGRERNVKQQEVSGRVQGALTVRVSNRDQFPASFRLESIKPDVGSDYHLREQWLRVDPGSDQETVIAVKPHTLNWWRWNRPYGVHILTTPLTGSTKIDQTVALETPAAFHQTLAWLHPLPLGCVALAVLALALSGKPDIREFKPETQLVLREPLDLQDLQQQGRVFDVPAAEKALAALRIGSDGRAKLSWKVQGARSLELQYLSDAWSTKSWRKVELDAGALKLGSGDALLDDGGKNGKLKFRFRLIARGLLPWNTRVSQEQVVDLAAGARAGLSLQRLLPGARPPTAVSRNGIVVVDIRNTNARTSAGYNDLTVWTYPSTDDIQREFPNEPKDITPDLAEPWKYRASGRGLITVVANAKNGLVWQYRVESGGGR